ncbi:MAG: hypothetical protein KDI56_11410, partial [Xanthomonadales bacterium]|nr:hypothetical protein [Xanthomonadales bacterium]
MSESGAAQEDIAKLSDMLDASGRLDVPAGFSGQVDVTGYRLRLTDDGHPRLVSDADWGDEFGLDRGCDGNVLAAAVGNEGEVYFGGWFNYCDEVRANNLVRYDPATDAWLPLGDNGNGVNGAVLALSVADGILYVGGDFTEVDGGLLANHVAAWDTTTAQWRTFGQGTNGVVRAITVSPQGDLFVGGSFSEVTTSAAIVASNVARWNNTSQSWTALEGVGGQGVDGLVYAMNWLNGNLYVGGQFTEVNVGAPQSVLALAIWSQLGGWSSLGGQASVQGNVYALANDGTDLFVGGNLFAVSQPNGDQLESRGIARWSPASARWTGLGEPNLTPIDLGGSVRSITIVGGSLVIGGSFYGLTHPDRMRSLARWDLVGESWSSLDGLLGTGAIGDVSVVAGVGDDIYVGGNYRQTREQGTQINRGSVTRWDLSMGVASTLASATGGAAHGDVGAVAFLDGDMYVTGVSSVGGEIAHGIARWDGQSWDLLDTDASTISGGSLAVLDGEIYVGGDSMSLPGIPVARGVARWTPATRTWSLLGTAQANGVDGVVLALTVHDGKLIVGGLFEHANFDVSSGGSTIRADNIA